MQVTKAKREKIKVPILLMGASGSGKTLSSLMIAKGMVERMLPDISTEDQWEKIGVVDDEHRRSNLYVNTEHDGVTIGEFSKVDLVPPFTASRLSEAVSSLQQAGCVVVIIDSLSAFWSGDGGILEQVSDAGGGMQAWNAVTPEQKELIKALITQDVHIIATVRTKTGVNVTTDEVGKAHVEKVGTKMEQKEGLEYEFAITFQLYQSHVAEAIKDNSSIFQKSHVLTPDDGKKVFEWAELGIDVRAQEKERHAKAVKSIEDLAIKSEAVAKELEMQIKQVNGVPLTDWPLDNLKRLYLGLSKIAQMQAESKTTESNDEKEGN